jgi:hypothetical protein
MHTVSPSSSTFGRPLFLICPTTANPHGQMWTCLATASFDTALSLEQGKLAAAANTTLSFSTPPAAQQTTAPSTPSLTPPGSGRRCGRAKPSAPPTSRPESRAYGHSRCSSCAQWKACRTRRPAPPPRKRAPCCSVPVPRCPGAAVPAQRPPPTSASLSCACRSAVHSKSTPHSSSGYASHARQTTL